MKICLVIPPYLPVPAVKGGAVETLAEDLIKLNEKYDELQIDCITLEDCYAKKEYSKYPKTNFICFSAYDNKFMNFVFRCINFSYRKVLKKNFDLKRVMISNKYRRLINSKKYDFIISEGVNDYLTSKVLKNIDKNKLILHIHKDTEPTKEFEEMYGNFIGISEFVSKRFNDNNIIEKNRIYTVYNGVNFEKFDKVLSNSEKSELRNRYNIIDDDIVCLYTGRLLPMKGVKELIQAFKKMKKNKSCKLIIVGSAVSGSNNETNYTLELKELANGENIIFVGYISNNELYKYYQISDMAIFPSLTEEGFGLVVVEAMRSKLPLIITDSGGMKEIVTDDCALKVEMDEKIVENLAFKIEKLCVDNILREKMGKASYDNSEKFSAENYYKNYVKTLKEINIKMTKTDESSIL